MSNGGDPGNRTLVDKILAKDFRSPLLSPINWSPCRDLNPNPTAPNGVCNPVTLHRV